MKRLLLAPFLVLASLFHGPTHTQIVDRVQSSIVRVTGEKDVMTLFGPVHAQYVCTGFVIGVSTLPKKTILTAAHCAGDPMFADGVPAKVLKVDKYYDLALLEADSTRPVLEFRYSPVERFEKLTALGYAFGWTHITALDVPAFLIDVAPDSDIAPGILTQGGYIGGMSGGPVVDQSGYVVGIVQQSNEGVGYGVGVVFIQAFLDGVLR